MINWISIKDRLPPKNVKILIFMPRYDFVAKGEYMGDATTYDEEDDCFLEDWRIEAGDESYEPQYEISHWAEFSYPVKGEERQPHPSILPLPEHNAPDNCELMAHTDCASFKDEKGNWVLYWKDGRYLTPEQIRSKKID